ncbi:radical SAM family heme chaperone HemW [Roseicyclus marinus]|uniref:radical SAM family heme chaperone HemW n=1 Tax=Roseicyclus marinus TaxID=2161673 RepID=UPI00241037AE|nr:radical SAM family heme chaperone HemW [Roseicyclus marinus]MDG3041457.1 radical SAM family heme chaperone HemW [Roseicyclus marinus]
MAEPWEAGGFGLYIHWPFCQAKCPYCDFNSHVASEIDQARWKAAYLSEIERVSAELPGRRLTSIYFGGGTPSLMAPNTVAAMLDAIRGKWALANDLEVTLEANPTSVEAERFRAFRDAGVNRVSMGLQALNDTDLKRLGRLHSAAEGRNAYEIARDVFPRVSFDLIYARQYQDLEDWRAELAEALTLAADHLSLYQLTIEEGTAFGDRYAIGRLGGLVEDDTAAAMYDLTQEMCEAAGLPAYEVSNHAGDMAQSRHNLIYWRGGDYAGIGPGAHGRITLNGQRQATETDLSPLGWLRRVETQGSGETLRETVSGREQAEEYAMMALRLSEGMDRARFVAMNGADFDPDVLNRLESLGMIEVTEQKITTTLDGRRVLNAVLRDLLAEAR